MVKLSKTMVQRLLHVLTYLRQFLFEMMHIRGKENCRRNLPPCGGNRR